jgi:deazaflavin-dependent oxidoreductase (nitroreductase family)
MAGDDFANALQEGREISVTVTGRKTGRAITIPVWFVSRDRVLWLLPVKGSETPWYQNLEKNPAITVDAGGVRRDLRARLLNDQEAVSEVVRQFREKYGPEEIERWYTLLDVAVQIPFASGYDPPET